MAKGYPVAGKKLLALRERLSLTQEEMAVRAGMSLSAYRRVENAKATGMMIKKLRSLGEKTVGVEELKREIGLEEEAWRPKLSNLLRDQVAAEAGDGESLDACAERLICDGLAVLAKARAALKGKTEAGTTLATVAGPGVRRNAHRANPGPLPATNARGAKE